MKKQMARPFVRTWSNVGYALADIFAIPVGIVVGVVTTTALMYTDLLRTMYSDFYWDLMRSMGDAGAVALVRFLGVLAGLAGAGIAAAAGCVVVWALSLPFQTDKGRVSMGAHVPLALLVGGLYNLFWLGHCTDYLNKAQNEEHRVINGEILLCLFVPFYQIFWFVEHANRVDWMAKSNGIDENDVCNVWYILCAVLLPGIAAIILQCRINKIDKILQRRARFALRDGVAA